ncbi:MAG: TonB-dependent receptor domain-containing protein, partial [Lentisphaeria bacterium]
AYEAEGQSNTRGIEFSAVGNITKNWSMNFAYAFTQYMGEQGKFDRYPPHAASLFTTYKVDELFNGTVFGLGVRWRQKSDLTLRGLYISEDDYIAESVSVDASVEVPIKLAYFEKSSLHFGVKNIFDERFVESARNNECFINNGRTFELSFRASF